MEIQANIEYKMYDVPHNSGQRAIADIIENDVVNQLIEQGGIAPKSVRTIEDVTFKGVLVDVKTRDIGREFSMPNLISVDRLSKNRNTEIAYLFIDYVVNPIDGETAQIVNIEYRPIESIDWHHLSIQNLGLGQLQLVKTDKGINYFEGTKDDWFFELKLQMGNFYERQIRKFETLRKKL